MTENDVTKEIIKLQEEIKGYTYDKAAVHAGLLV